MPRMPLFPLNAVLFPGTRLPLKIFEQRYLDMVKTCLRQDEGFAVVLISKGQEVGLPPDIFSVGTYARIIDWHQHEAGILGITVEGCRRVRINEPSGDIGQLLTGKTEFIAEPALEAPLDEDLAGLLQRLEAHPLVQAVGLNVDYQNPVSIIWGLSSLLPFNNTEKQYLLELDDPAMRYSALRRMLHSLGGAS